VLLIAHGISVRTDLPVPEFLFWWAAAIVLVVSFVGLATLWPTPRLQDPGWRPLLGGFGRALASRPVEILCGAIGVFLFGLTIYAGFEGTQSTTANWTPIFIFVIFWLAFVPLGILFGDVFRAFNPWRAIARGAGWVTARIAGPLPTPFRYPEWLGRWPAVVGLFGFAWMELSYTDGSDPSTLAVAALVYSAITLLAIACFGTEAWIARGEAFSVYFNMFSRISPVELRDGRLGLRRPLSALPRLEPAAGTIALLIVMIGTVAFDGASEGKPWVDVAPDIQDFFTSLGFSLGTALEITFTIGMLIGVGLVATIYFLGVAGVRTLDRRPLMAVARSYMHTLVPIAAAYVIAHYFSLLVYNGQAIAYLASDPLGEGSDLFGTAGRAIDYGVINASGVWYVQVGVLVLGHVCGLILAHDRALAMYEKARAATTSQYWMLAVMVAFTTGGLFLLSQANQ
jgi:hypothetical protein